MSGTVKRHGESIHTDGVGGTADAVFMGGAGVPAQAPGACAVIPYPKRRGAQPGDSRAAESGRRARRGAGYLPARCARGLSRAVYRAETHPRRTGVGETGGNAGRAGGTGKSM